MMFCREQVAGRRASEDELSTAPNYFAGDLILCHLKVRR